MEKPVRSSFQYLSISYECALAIGNSLNLPEMLQEVIHMMVHKTNAHRGIIWVKNGEQQFQPVANAGINIEDVLVQSGIMDLRDVLNQIQKKQQFVLRYKNDKDFLQYCPVLTGKEETVLIVPVNNVAILYLVYAIREIADEPLANLLSSLSKKLSVAIEACTAHENVIKEIQVREKAEKELTKKTEQLRVSKQNFHDLVENLMDGVAIADENAYHIYVNPKFSEITGYSRDELLNMSGWDFTPPEEIDKLKQRMKDRMAGKTVQTHYDQTIVKKDGTKIPVEMSSTVTIWQGKKRPLAIIHDITERKQAEEALRENQERLGTILSTMDIGLILHNPDRTVVWVNQWVRQMFQHGDPVGRVCHEFFEGTNSPCNPCAVRDCFETGEICTVENYNQAIGRWYLSIAHPMKENAKHVTQVLESVMDITERKQAEIALQESEHRLLRAQEVANVGDWEFDVETGVNAWSDELYNIYGFNHVDEIKLETMLAGIHPDDRDYVNEMLAGWIENGEGEPFEYRIIRPYDGSIRHVYSPVEAVCDSNGNVVKIYGTALDITDRKNDEESLKIYARELARSNKELKSLDKMKDEFLSNVSHELKTPLVSIKGFSEVMQGEMYGSLNEEQKKVMDAIIRNSERLGRLINSILYLTIQKSGKDKYAIHPVNITGIIGNALIDISPQINSKKLTIENNTPSDLPLIKGDADKLTQVFINLLENATKFTPNGGKIIVAAFEDNENIHITVNDTGIGISADVISNLFERFYQVDASTTRKYGGTGIGLYISKLIVEVHKGKMWAESEEGVGATFHVLLPK